MTNHDDWVSSFLSHAGLAEPLDREPLAQQLIVSVEAAQAAWPNLHISPASFVAHLGRVLAAEPRDAAVALASLHVSDLYLACACLQKDARAIEELDRLYLVKLGHAIRAPGASQRKDEILQMVREKVYMGLDGVGKLALYSGRGKLAGWLAGCDCPTHRVEPRAP